MADNRILPFTGSGDTTATVRTIEKSTPTAAHTQSVVIDVGGTGAEALLSASNPMPVSDNGGSITVDGSVSLSAVTPGTGATNLGKAEDAAHSSGDVGVMALAVRNDAGSAFAADGDYVPLSIDASGALRVTGGGGGTEYTEDVASAADPTGNQTILRRRDTLSATEVSADGDNIAANATSKGELYVKHVDAIPVTDNSGSLTVDGTVTANLAAGTNNIGDVDVLSVPAPLSTTGGGTEATALRVTIASDSTGVLSVDDNGSTLSVDDGGGSLTVDGTVGVSGTVTVDTELPAAAALADNTANPTAPAVGAFLMAFDGTNWDRVQTGAAATGSLKVDGSAVTQPVSGTVTANAGTGTFTVGGVAASDAAVSGNPVLSAGRASAAAPTDVSADGDVVTEWRLRNGAAATVITAAGALVGGDATNGLDVDVTRVSGTVTVGGVAAHDAAVSGNPVRAAGRARTADITAVAQDDTADIITDTLGKPIVLVGSVPDLQVNGKGTFSNTTAADLIAAGGAGVKIAVMGVLVTNSSATTATKVEIRDGTTVKIQGLAGIGGGFNLSGATPLFYTTANTAVTGRCVTTGADVDIFVWGYKCV